VVSILPASPTFVPLSPNKRQIHYQWMQGLVMVLLDLVIVKSCGVNKFSSSMIIVHCLLNCRALLCYLSDVIHLVASSALVKRLGVISPLL
jgi:hypothetical protein